MPSGLDRRVPGQSEPKGVLWVCPVPGCNRQRWSGVSSSCSVHGVEMEEVSVDRDHN